MTNPINPNYSGVTIQISNPSVYAGGQGLCPVQSAGVCAQAPQIPLQQNSGITSPIQPSYSYPPQYYLNNYNYQGASVPTAEPAAISSEQNGIKSLLPASDGINTPSEAQEQNSVKQEQAVKKYKANIPEPQDLSKSQGVIDDLDARAKALEDEKNNAKESKTVPLTDEYIKSLENYLNNPNDEIRLMASKEILTRLDEDKRRYDDPALNALLNKMLQDPSKLIRIAALSAFSSELASGNDYTVTLLHNIQSNPSADKEDILQAADILLKMSQGKEVKDIPNPQVKDKADKG